MIQDSATRPWPHLSMRWTSACRSPARSASLRSTSASAFTSLLLRATRASADRLFHEITQAALPPGMTQKVLASGQTSVLTMA
jgi:hypothetical protein